jgi:hypothetical protein
MIQRAMQCVVLILGSRKWELHHIETFQMNRRFSISSIAGLLAWLWYIERLVEVSSTSFGLKVDCEWV